MGRRTAVSRRLADAWLPLCALVALPALASAQGAASARKLDAEAAVAFQSATPARCLQAAKLWIAAADEYTAFNWTTDAAAALRNTGRAYACAGDEAASLGYLGRAADLDNAAASYRALTLLDRSPVYDPGSRDIAEDARFVGAVNDLLRALGGDKVTSADEAQAALESLVSQRLAPITVRAEDGPVNVELRRYRYSLDSSPNAPWERVTTDVTIKRPPAAYHFRYRSPATSRDTTVLYRCADGCNVLVR
ncbi:MAG TPA: hypothetical protein VH764_02450 [Gemmatimonadales bacterium]|jgi:hypothetical protein